jgi:hypothetical protein
MTAADAGCQQDVCMAVANLQSFNLDDREVDEALKINAPYI